MWVISILFLLFVLVDYMAALFINNENNSTGTEWATYLALTKRYDKGELTKEEYKVEVRKLY